MHQITLTHEQESVINTLQQKLGYERMLIIGLDSTYEKSSILFRNIHVDFIPGVLKQQCAIIESNGTHESQQSPTLKPVV